MKCGVCKHFTVHEFRLAVPRAIHMNYWLSIHVPGSARLTPSQQVVQACPLFRAIVSTHSHTHHWFLCEVQFLYRGLKFDQNLKPYFKINLRFNETDLCFHIQITLNKIVHYSAITHINYSFTGWTVFELLMIKSGKCFLKHLVHVYKHTSDTK